MTVFTNLSEKGVTERLKLSPVVQIAKRKFPALALKTKCCEPEKNKLTVLLKSVNCYSDDSAARPMQSGEGIEFPSPRRKSTLIAHSSKQHSVFGGNKEDNKAISKDARANNGKAKTSRNKEEQSGVRNFVLKSRSFPVLKPFEMSHIDEHSKIQQSFEEPEHLARDVLEQKSLVLEQEPKNSRASRLKGGKKSQSLAMACSILEGHKISFKTKQEKIIPKDSTKHSRPSADQHVSPRYSTLHQQTSCQQDPAQNGETHLRPHKQHLKQPSTCEFAGYETLQGSQEAKKHSKDDYLSTDDDNLLGELVARPKCPARQNEGVLQNGAPQIKLKQGICKVHCTASEGKFLCLVSTQPNNHSQRDGKEQTKLTSRHEKWKSAVTSHLGRETFQQTCHKATDSLLPCKSQDTEQNDSLLRVDEQNNKKIMQPSNEARSLSPVLEKRETFQLPKVETYEISPRSILDSKACSVFSNGNRRKLFRRRISGGEWVHKRKTGIFRPSVFEARVNEQHRVTIRQPSPVAGVKISVKDPEAVLVNTALQEVENCNIPSVHEEMPPPVKKFVIRLPPVC